MMPKLKTFLFFLCAVFLLQEATASFVRINDFRFFADTTKIRLVFDTSGSINYTVQEFPNKIVINIKNAKLVGSLNKMWLSKTPIKSVQSSQLDKDLCLTLNLKNPVKLQHFVLQKPYRLTLDLFTLKVTPVEPAVSVVGNNEIDSIEEKIIKEQINKPYMVTKETESVPDPVVLNNADNKNLRDVIVVIDPGHGGKDSGAVGFRGTREKDIALAVAKILQNTINHVKGFRAVLTRNSDCFISLRERLGIAHKYKADMFVAIHADAYRDRSAHGASVFALSQRGATSEAARWLAEKENESELGQTISDKNELLRSVLIDLAQTATIAASLEIGDALLQEFTSITHLHSQRVEQAAFVVLKSPDIPSLLVETGFISDPYTENKLRDASYQQKIANCMARGITEYFMRRPPQGTYLVKTKHNIDR